MDYEDMTEEIQWITKVRLLNGTKKVFRAN